MQALILVEDAAREIDGLDRSQRTLLACVYQTADRNELAATVARETAEAIVGGLTRNKHGRQAIAEFIEFHLAVYADDIDDTYFAEHQP